MKTAQSKLIAWTAAGALGVGLALYMVHFAGHQGETHQMVTMDQMKQGLSGVTPPDENKDDGVVEYDPVKKGWISLNWIGRPKETKVDKPVEAPVVVVDNKSALSKLVKVIALYYDPSSEMETRCVLRYQTDAHVDASKTKQGTVWKRVGDKLEAPLDYAHVAKIDERGVEFAFNDEARAHELLRPLEYDLAGNGGRLKVLGEDSELVLPPVTSLPRASNYGQWPDRSVQVGANQFKIGVQDAKEFSENYDRILAEARIENHFDPVTHKRDGLVIKDLKPGSVISQYGGETGDVIKSVNGHPVSSQQEAIQWVKANAGSYDKWEVEVENHGDTHIVTIYPPKN